MLTHGPGAPSGPDDQKQENKKNMNRKSMRRHPEKARPAARPRGFSLLELSVALAVAAVLAALALPAYQDHVRRARRAEAKVVLARIQLHQERYRAGHRGYASGLGALCAPGCADGAYDTAYYRFSTEALAVGNDPAGGFLARAEARPGGPQAGDREGGAGCAVLTLESGAAGPRRLPGGCWR